MNFPLPQLGEGLFEAEMIRWLVHPGDNVKVGQALLEVLTDKATMEVPAPFAGKIQSLIAEPGAKVKIGQTVLDYQPANLASVEIPQSNGDGRKAAAVKVKVIADMPITNAVSRIAAAPSVRHLARKLGINLAEVIGSGPSGRILIDDITRIAQAEHPPKNPKALTAPDYGLPGTVLKYAGLRRSIGEHLSQSKNIIPHFSYVDECDVTELVRLRKSLREQLLEKNVKLTYLAFFVKAVVQALKAVPIINSSLDDASQTIRLHEDYNVGIAVATPTGLVVPVIHHAEAKDLLTIAREIDSLSEAARLGKNRHEDSKGGTFTISSVGNIGGLISTPIINHPEVGIMGIGKIVKRPVYGDDGELHPAEIAYLSFSFDHRVVDGAVGAAFANKVIECLKNPAAMLLKM